MAVKYAKAYVYLYFFSPKEGCYCVRPWTENFLIASFENHFPLWMSASVWNSISFFFPPPPHVYQLFKPMNLVAWIFSLGLQNLVLVSIENCFHLVNDWTARQLRMPFIILVYNFLVVLSIQHCLQWRQQLASLLADSISILSLSFTEKECFAFVLQIMRKYQKILVCNIFFFLL